jgi:molecular chaperone DnaK (HSP70)
MNNIIDNDDDFAFEFMKQKIEKNSILLDNNDDIDKLKEYNYSKKNISGNKEIIDIYIDDEILGIDLGTTKSSIGIWRNNKFFLIPDEYGNTAIPSYVGYTNVQRYIGNDAKRQQELNPNNVFYEVKRLIGRNYSDSEVQKNLNYLSYKIENDGKDGVILVSDVRDNKKFTPEEISASVLTKLKIMAMNYLKKKITKVVITVPATFTEAQRQATKDAASIAGLECVRMIHEPTAAALAYGLMNKSLNKKKEGDDSAIRILVYDFGGGTLDVSVLEVEDQQFCVTCVAGNTRLGGADFDNSLVRYCITKFKRKYNIVNMPDLPTLSLQMLKLRCEDAKKILSTSNSTYIAVKDFYQGKNLCIPISRSELEIICADLLLLSLNPIEEVLNELEIREKDIDDVIVVGGMSRMPAILNRIEMKFRRKPNCSINPEQAIVAGAAIQGYLLSHSDDPFSSSVTLLDITPLSIGVETNQGIMDVLVPRGTIIPYETDRLYSTEDDNQTSVIIKIYEGERSMTNDNMFVGEFILNGIPPEPRGVPEINVIFNIDNNGITTVTAELVDQLNEEENNIYKDKKEKDKLFLKKGIEIDDYLKDNEIEISKEKREIKNSIIIQSNKGRLTNEQIRILIEDAKELEAQDEMMKVRKWMHYELDDLCHNILTNIDNENFKLNEDDKKLVKQDINKVFEWLKEKKYYERKEEELQEALNKLKKRYGVLILKGKLSNNNNVEEKIDINTIKNSTSIYGNDIDESEEEKIFEQIENEEMGISEMEENDKNEIKELRKNLMDLSYSVFNILSSDYLIISHEDKIKIRDFIDDTLLWMHVHEKISKNEYKSKIDEINDICNNIFEEYNKKSINIFKSDEISENIKNKIDELETLCYTIKIMIEDGVFQLKKIYLDKLLEILNANLDWIILEKEKGSDLNLLEQECENKINEINEICKDYDNKMNGINFNKENDIVREGIILGNDDENNCMGTSILSLIRADQEHDVQQLIIDTIDEIPDENINIDDIIKENEKQIQDIEKENKIDIKINNKMIKKIKNKIKSLIKRKTYIMHNVNKKKFAIQKLKQILNKLQKKLKY